MSEFNLDDWPDCIVLGCQNKCCLALDSDRCYPHTTGFDPTKKAITKTKETERELVE